MALPTVIAKNQTISDIFLPRVGLTVPASSQETLTDYVSFYEASFDEVLVAKITAGDIVINDGTDDLSTAEALAYLDATGNLNGPVTGAAAGKLLRLLDATGRFTEVAGPVIFDAGAADPGGGSDGDLYYNTVLEKWMAYDGTRSKWLSIESNTIQVGNNGNVPVGTYFRGIAGQLLSDTIGYTAEWNGTVIGLTWTRNDADAATFNVKADGVTIESSASAAVSGYDNTLDGDFAQGEVLAVENDAGGNAVQIPQIWVKFKWRAT